MPITVRPSSCQASTRGRRSVVLPDPATPVSNDSFPPPPSAWMAASCSFEKRTPASSASTRPIAARIAASARLAERSRAAVRGHVGDGLFDAELLGVADPLPAFMQAEDQRDGLAVMDEAASLDESHDRVDVVPSARGAGFDEAPRGMDAQAFGVEDGVQREFRREGGGGARVSRLEPLRVRPPGGLRGAEDGSRRPADGRRLVSPDRVRFLLGLAEPPGGARFMQDLLLALERELVPVHRVFAGVALRVADHLSVAFREGGDRALGDVEGDGRFAAGVEADPEAQRAQTVGEAGLKERSVFRHLVGGQGLGVRSSRPGRRR